MAKLSVHEAYGRLHGETTLREWYMETRDRLVTSPWDGLRSYLQTAPSEDFHTEHALVTLRRFIATKALNQDLAVHLVEPTTPAEITELPGPSPLPSAVRLECLRLLAEAGLWTGCYELLDDANRPTPQDLTTELGFEIAKAKLLRDTGRFDRSFRLLEKLEKRIGVGDQASDRPLRYLRHSVKKNKATLLRRLYVEDLVSGRKEILHLFDEASNDCHTYQVCFSRGFVHYSLAAQGVPGSYAKAEAEYQQCLELLGDYSNEYYLVHLFYALALIAKKVSKRGTDRRFRPRMPRNVGDIKQHLNAYSESAGEFGNFKTHINSFIHDLIKRLFDRADREELAQEVRGRLPALLKNREVLYACRQDIRNALDFFSLEHGDPLRRTCQTVLDEYDDRFRRKAMVFDKETQRTFRVAVSLCVDIRGSTRVTIADQARAFNQVDVLRELVARHLLPLFDDAAGTGDGFILTHYLPERFVRAEEIFTNRRECSELILRIVAAARELIAELDRPRGVDQDLERFDVGVGIACNAIIEVRTQEVNPAGRSETYFAGKAAYLASRMSDLARPTGIAIHCDRKYVKPQLLRRRLQHFRLQTFRGKHSYEAYDALVSDHVNMLALETNRELRFVSKAADSGERRLFVDYGSQCHVGCVYCFSGGRGHQELSVDQAIEEVAWATKREDGPVLISLGCHNDPLIGRNAKDTAELTVRLLESFDASNVAHVVQLASKASPTDVLNFRDYVQQRVGSPEEEGRTRVAVMYSVSTIEWARELEPVRTGVPEQLDVLNEVVAGGLVSVIPYVKPFLPGISDGDSQLLAFLSGRDVVAIGHPYWSHKLLRDMCSWCLVHKPDAAKFYKYGTYRKKTLPLPHPHPARQELAS